MKEKIQVHMWFNNGHIAVLLESNALVLHLRLPEDQARFLNSSSTRHSFFIKDQYVWDGTTLHYHYPNPMSRYGAVGRPCEKIAIPDMDAFQKTLADFTISDPNLLDLYLSPAQAIELMTPNNEQDFKYIPQFYELDRWKDPEDSFMPDSNIQCWRNETDISQKNNPGSVHRGLKKIFQDTSNSYHFEIIADPAEIIKEWKSYQAKTKNKASLFGNNCAVATQWFLNQFAHIPAPTFLSAPVSCDQIMPSLDIPSLPISNFRTPSFSTPGLYIPSFIPSPTMVPKRILEHAKFHLESDKNAEIIIAKTTYLAVNLELAKSALLTLGSAAGSIVAGTFLSNGLSFCPVLAMTTLAATAALSAPRFFSAINKRAERVIADDTILRKSSVDVSSQPDIMPLTLATSSMS